jgi:plastocyanin
MIYTPFLFIGLLAGHVAAEDVEAINGQALSDVAIERGRELFPIAIGAKCARYCSARCSAPRAALGADASAVKGPVKALEMLALNDDLNTMVTSDSMCTRRQAMARAMGLAAGLAAGVVGSPGFAAETKMVKMGADSGQLVFVPDEISICKGDSVTWINNKGGPHNVVFDAEAIPSGVDADSISMDDQLGDEGATYTKKFDAAGSYSYYCEPHAGAGMKATLIVK